MRRGCRTKQAITSMNTKLVDELIWDNKVLPAAYEATVPGSASVFTFNLIGSPGAGFQIDSQGTSGQAHRTVHATLDVASNWEGIGVKDTIDIKMESTFLCIPADATFSLRTNSILPSAVTIKPYVTIPGDVIVGPGGDTNVVINTKATTIIEGDTYAESYPMVYSPVTVPTDEPSLGNLEVKVGQNELITGNPGNWDPYNPPPPGRLPVFPGQHFYRHFAYSISCLSLYRRTFPTLTASPDYRPGLQYFGGSGWIPIAVSRRTPGNEERFKHSQ